MKKKKTIQWILVVLWMLLIFFLSEQPAVDSKALSSDTAVWIVQIVEKICPCLEMQTTDIHSPLRKLAHFFLYFVLGIFFTQSLEGEKWNRKKKWIGVVLACVLYAMSDEFHQAFVPGRGAQWSDVLIDSIGSMCGIGLTFLCKRHTLHRQKKRVY
ncbi:MAG: VanZ family protein [Caldisericia bacterium]|nr:VanZ family protein [Caldisericia bacterium]MDD4614921.1 VanZ family protein [Caldisericia bacterium]